MSNFNFKNPIVLSLITFFIITMFQVYQNYYKNKVQNDDYTKPCPYHMMKAPIIAAIVTWLVTNFLLESLENNQVENQVDKKVTFNSKILPNNFSPENTLKNIYTEQPDF